MRKEPGFGADYKDLRNGDWEYAAYHANGSLLDQPQQTGACASCHLKQAGANIDYTFRTNLFGNKDAAAVMPKVGDNTIQMWNYGFHDANLTVKAGATVTWVNNDDAEHTVDAKDGSFSSGGTLKTINIKPGDSFSFKFDKVGTYDYFCKVHPFMKGTITVQ
jgi:plastocyanin